MGWVTHATYCEQRSYTQTHSHTHSYTKLRNKERIYSWEKMLVCYLPKYWFCRKERKKEVCELGRIIWSILIQMTRNGQSPFPQRRYSFIISWYCMNTCVARNIVLGLVLNMERSRGNCTNGSLEWLCLTHGMQALYPDVRMLLKSSPWPPKP